MSVMRRVVLLLILAASVALVLGTASARVWHVDDDLMDFPRAVQIAIDTASPGDSIKCITGRTERILSLIRV